MLFNPDESWYLKRDGRRKLSPRCPIAANDKCPRYYLSQRYASTFGPQTLKLSDEVRTRIEANWAATDAFSSIEQSVGAWLRKDGSLRGVAGFCPEVTARIFGLYCVDLRNYPDEEAERTTQKQLDAESAKPDDPRRIWMVVEPRHYTECHEFSVYGAAPVRSGGKTKTRKGSLPPKVRFAVFDRDNWRCVYCGKTSAEATLHVDHKTSVANGGDDSMENLATACEECNLGKGAANVVFPR